MHAAPRASSIARQLLIRVVAFYVIFTVVLFVADVSLQYHTVKAEVIEELRLIHQSFAPGLAQALWDINTSQVQSFFEGMTRLPIVIGGEIRDESGKTICVGGTVREEDGTVALIDGTRRRVDSQGWGEVFSYAGEITFGTGDDVQKVGDVVIYSSSDVVLRRLMLGIKLTLVEMMLSAAALCLIFVVLFRRLLERPLRTLTSAVADFNPDRIEDFELTIDTPGRNEFKVLEESFNRMAASLAQDRNKLLRLRDELEGQVERRTAELREKASTEASLAGLTSHLQGRLTLSQIADVALAAIVENTGAPAGAFYVLEGTEQLHRRAEHALPRGLEAETTFSLGSGSIGQAGKSRQMLLQTLEGRKWAITFGLGSATPRQVVTCPLVVDGVLTGVVEVYLLSNLDEANRQWLGKAAEIVATALRLAQERAAKERADERIRLILESMPDCMIIVDRRGEIVMTNAVTQETFGYDTGELIGQPVTILMPQRYRDAHAAHLAAFVDDPHVREMGSGLDLFAVRRDGTEFPVEISLNAIDTDDGLLIVAALRDVTRLKSEQARLRILSRATDQSPASVVITDREGRIEYVNPKFTEVTGYSLTEVVGQSPRVLKSGRQPPEFYRDLWETIASGEEWYGEFCNKRKNGETYWERASISPIRDERGEISHFVAVKEDITERKRRQGQTRGAEA